MIHTLCTGPAGGDEQEESQYRVSDGNSLAPVPRCREGFTNTFQCSDSTLHRIVPLLRYTTGMATVQGGNCKEGSTGASQIDASISDDERFSQLAPYELSWTRRQPFLQSRGYMLRPRYRPGWVPSWRITGARPIDCEDSNVHVCGVAHKPNQLSAHCICQVYPHVIDATRISDGKLVTIKCVTTGCLEMRIAMMLGMPPLSEDPTNHCVSLLDVFEDAANTNVSYIVMPFLRDFDNPPFECVEDVLDFGEQLLEVSTSIMTHITRHRALM